MANLNSSNFNSLKPGILNCSTTDQPLSKGFLTSGSAVFVEDGNGVKSGLKLGIELAEVIEPTTDAGIVNVSFANRTYAAIEDLKIVAAAMEIYREQTKENFVTVIKPFIDTIDSVSKKNSEISTKLGVVEDNLSTFVDSGLINRVKEIENNYISKLGSTGLKADLSAGLNRIIDLADPQKENDSANKKYVDQQISDLRIELLAAISSLNSI